MYSPAVVLLPSFTHGLCSKMKILAIDAQVGVCFLAEERRNQCGLLRLSE
jgi:hypothetical protein